MRKYDSIRLPRDIRFTTLEENLRLEVAQWRASLFILRNPYARGRNFKIKQWAVKRQFVVTELPQ